MSFGWPKFVQVTSHCFNLQNYAVVKGTEKLVDLSQNEALTVDATMHDGHFITTLSVAFPR